MYGLAVDRHYPFHSHTRSYDTSQGASQGVPQTSIASQNDCLFELTYKLYDMFMSKLLQPCDLSLQVLPRVLLKSVLCVRSTHSWKHPSPFAPYHKILGGSCHRT